MIPKHLINIYRYFLRYKWTATQAIQHSIELRQIFEYFEPDESIELIEKYKCQQ